MFRFLARKTNRHKIKTALFLLISFRLATLSVADEPKRYALLVAVTKYNHAELNKPVPLRYPEVDAKSIGKFLESHGYQVDYLLGKNATQKAIQKKLSGLSKQGNSDGVCLIGFWGHGVEFSGSNESMFCPFDSGVRFAKDSLGKPLFDKTGKNELLEPDPETLVGMGSVFKSMKLCPAGNKLLIADCGRNSPNQARGRAFGSNVKIGDLPENMAAIFACKAGEVAFEHEDWGHGAFSKALLDLLPNQVAKKDSTITGLLSPLKKSVNQLVVDKSNGREKQTVFPIFNGIPDLKLKPSIVKKRIKNSIGMEFALIPKGTFLMGSPKDEKGRGNEEALHNVTLTKDYYMGVTEVTQSQWKEVMGTEPWLSSGQPRYGVKNGKNNPVVWISWNDANSFCQKLTRKEGVEYRLPTEAEWERACRCGSKSRFEFGESSSSLSRYGWFNENALNINEEYAHEVRKKKPNRFGLYDMHGNVYEWCADFYSETYYSRSPKADPKNTRPSSYRVYRGGSYSVGASDCRSATRLGQSPNFGIDNIGFRVVQTIR